MLGSWWGRARFRSRRWPRRDPIMWIRTLSLAGVLADGVISASFAVTGRDGAGNPNGAPAGTANQAPTQYGATGQTGPHGNGQVPPGGTTVGPGSGNSENRPGYSIGRRREQSGWQGVIWRGGNLHAADRGTWHYGADPLSADGVRGGRETSAAVTAGGGLGIIGGWLWRCRLAWANSYVLPGGRGAAARHAAGFV
jgi:hypothetical protein